MFAALNAGIAVLGRMEEPLSAGFQRLQDRLEQWVRREDATSAGRTGSVVNRTRVIGVLIASGAGGLACAQLVLSEVRSFSENMSAGMGYLGVVAVIAGPGFTSGPRWLRHRRRGRPRQRQQQGAHPARALNHPARKGKFSGRQFVAQNLVSSLRLFDGMCCEIGCATTARSARCYALILILGKFPTLTVEEIDCQRGS